MGKQVTETVVSALQATVNSVMEYLLSPVTFEFPLDANM